MFGHAGYGAGSRCVRKRDSGTRGKGHACALGGHRTAGRRDHGRAVRRPPCRQDRAGRTRMQELRLVAVSEDGTYLVLATAGRGTRFTLPVDRSEEHTSELQSREKLVCRLLLEKKKDGRS